MDLYLGEITALLAAFSFSITSICYTLSGRKVDAITSLAMSLPVSWIVLIFIHQIRLGEFFPTSASLDRWFYLSASGILAFVISSYFMLNAYQQIGPRLTMLIASFAPVLGAILAWLFLGQTLPSNSLVGITIVVFGIVWVVAERSSKKKTTIERGDRRRGIILACLGTLAQATAFVFSSQGVADGFPPFSATLIRTTAGILLLWAVIAMQGKMRSTVRLVISDRKLFGQLSIAAISGPVIAGTLLLLSLQFVPVGVATTLSHTTSIILIPISYFIFKEKITLRAIVGTGIAIIGIAILFT